MIGKLKWFNGTKGYGIIEYSENEIMFDHYNSIELDGHKTLSGRNLVHHELLKTDEGLQAKKIMKSNS